jgi:hypothetical protein
MSRRTFCLIAGCRLDFGKWTPNGYAVTWGPILIAFIPAVIAAGVLKIARRIFWRSDKSDASKNRRVRDAAEMDADIKRGMLDAEQSKGMFDRLERDHATG